MYNAPRSSSRNMPRHGSYGRRRRKKPVALLVLVCLLAVALVSAGAIWLVSGSQTKKAVSAFVDYLAQDNYTLARDLYEDASAKRRAKLDVPLTDKLLALADQAKAGDVADGAPIMGLAKFGDLMKPALSAATEAVEQRYIRDESLTWEQYSRVLDTFGRLNCPVDRLKNATATGEYYRQSRACFAQGMQAEQSDDYLTACEMFRQVVPEDTKYYSDAQQRLAIAREKLAVNAFTTADTLVGQYQYCLLYTSRCV